VQSDLPLNKVDVCLGRLHLLVNQSLVLASQLHAEWCLGNRLGTRQRKCAHIAIFDLAAGVTMGDTVMAMMHDLYSPSVTNLFKSYDDRPDFLAIVPGHSYQFSEMHSVKLARYTFFN